MAQHEPVGVLGAGIMGRGIARVFASAGHEVVVCDVHDSVLRDSMARMRGDLDRAVSRSRLGADGREALLGRIRTTTSHADLAQCTLVIEAVPEELDLKQNILADVESVVAADAIIASNTSSLSVTSILSALTRPERSLGLHFFNPVHRMDLVEVVTALQTTESTRAAAVTLCEGAGKTTVTVNDRPGFVTSRVNTLIGNEAFTMLMEGVASAEDIDTALKLGLNHPMGPFELVDLVGLDTRLRILKYLHDTLGERFRPSPLLRNYVAAGRLGRKVGKGVYNYDEHGNRCPERP